MLISMMFLTLSLDSSVIKVNLIHRLIPFIITYVMVIIDRLQIYWIVLVIIVLNGFIIVLFVIMRSVIILQLQNMLGWLVPWNLIIRYISSYISSYNQEPIIIKGHIEVMAVQCLVVTGVYRYYLLICYVIAAVVRVYVVFRLMIHY